VCKVDTAMKTAIQKALAAVKADGIYKKLLDKWGLAGEAI
jgi:ABC-type amino acid transport substrate-binding protein